MRTPGRDPPGRIDRDLVPTILALGRIELQQLAALADTPLHALQVLWVTVAQLRGLAGDGLPFLGIFIELPFHPRHSLFLPLARAPPRTPGNPLQAVDAG